MNEDSSSLEAIDPIAEEPRRGRLTRAGLGRLSRRLALPAATAVAAASALIAATLLPLPSVAQEPAELDVAPVPTTQQLVCPGPLLRLSDQSGQDASATLALGQTELRSATSASELEQTALGEQAHATVLTAPPESGSDDAPLVAGLESQSVADGDYAGYSAAPCTPPSSESWLVGGATGLGRTTLLVLDNPTEVTASVTLEFYGDQGPVSAPGTGGILVPSGERRVFALAAFVPEIAAPVVHVLSRGGLVSASLQQSVVRGLEPGGTDIVPPTAAPAARVELPGIRITDPDAIGERIGAEGYEDLQTVVRVLAPGNAAVPVRVQVVPQDPEVDGAEFELVLEPGEVSELPLDELVRGSYLVRLEADAPVVAAARVSQVEGDYPELAWVTATAPLADTALVPVAPGATPRLHVANPGSEEATALLVDAEGEERELSVPAGGSITLPVDEGEHRLENAAGLRAVVTYAGEGARAAAAVQPPAPTSGAVTIVR